LAERNGPRHKRRVESLTDELAAKPYESLEPHELDELASTLAPLAALLVADPIGSADGADRVEQ
jgi:hypothetical protein